MKFGTGSGHLVTTNSETDYVVQKLTQKNEYRKRFRPYAADAGFCPTKNWLHINTQQEDTVTAATLKLYQGIGNGVEEVITDGFTQHGALLSTQVKLPNPPKAYGIDIGGYIDMIAVDRLGRTAAYEIKTTGAMPYEPKANHMSQAMTYACLGGLDVVYIVYVGRQVQAFPDPTPLVRVFELDVKEKLLDYMTTIVLSCHSLSKQNAPLRPVGFRKSNECNYCPFLQQCWNEIGFEFETPGESVEAFAEAEKTAYELLDMRESFFRATLSNAIGSASDKNKPRIIELMGKSVASNFAPKKKP